MGEKLPVLTELQYLWHRYAVLLYFVASDIIVLLYCSGTNTHDRVSKIRIT